MHAFVAGANGCIGQHLIPKLRAEGHAVTAFDRSMHDGPETRSVAGDVTAPDTYRDALADCDTAYYLIHAIGQDDFPAVEARQARAFRNAANAAGIDRIVYLGGIQPQAAPSRHLRSRRDVGRILAEADATVTELRAGIVLAWESVSFQLLHRLATRLPAVPVAPWMESLSQPIFIDDLVHYLAAAPRLDADAAAGAYDVGGPDALPYRQLVRTVATAAGSDPVMLPVPFAPPRLAAWIGSRLTGIDAATIRPLLESLRHDLPVRHPLTAVNHDPVPVQDAVKTILTEHA